MYKTESRNGERPAFNGERPARPRKLPTPPCPDCGDRYNVFSLIHKPDELYCFACNGFFTVKDVKKMVGEWTDFLSNRPGE